MNEHHDSYAMLSKLDELIAATKAATFKDRWLDAIEVGAMLSQNPRYVLQRLAPRPDFPKSLRIGQPRWKASEVMEWADTQREKSTRKPRKKVSQAA